MERSETANEDISGTAGTDDVCMNMREDRVLVAGLTGSDVRNP